MRLQDHYDWIVLGDHPAALWSASCVAQMGLSVLILPLGAYSTLKISHSGQYLDFESNQLVGFTPSKLGKLGPLGELRDDTSGLLLDCLSQLGRDLRSNKGHTKERCMIPQVVTPSARLSFPYQDLGLLRFELERELGEKNPAVIGLLSCFEQTLFQYQSCWKAFPQQEPHSWGLRRPVASVSSVLNTARSSWAQWTRGKPWGASPESFPFPKKLSDLIEMQGGNEVVEVLRGLLYGITSRIDTDPSLFDLVHLLSLSDSSLSFRGGMSAYRNELLSLAKSLGVHICLQSECRRLFIERGRFVGVQASHLGSMISATGGVLGCTLKQAVERMFFTGRHWFRKPQTPLLPLGWKMTVSLRIHEEAIPTHMQPRVIWQEDQAPPLEIERVPLTDYEKESRSKDFIVYLRTVMPFTMQSLEGEYQRMIAARMLRQFMEIIPFAESHVVYVYPEIRSPAALSLTEWCPLYDFKTLSAIPDALLVYGPDGLGSASGVEGLRLASAEAYPALGSFGATLAALESIRWIVHHSELPGFWNTTHVGR